MSDTAPKPPASATNQSITFGGPMSRAAARAIDGLKPDDSRLERPIGTEELDALLGRDAASEDLGD